MLIVTACFPYLSVGLFETFVYREIRAGMALGPVALPHCQAST